VGQPSVQQKCEEHDASCLYIGPQCTIMANNALWAAVQPRRSCDWNLHRPTSTSVIPVHWPRQLSFDV